MAQDRVRVSNRAAGIRRMAKAAGLSDMGERFINERRTPDEFFDAAASLLTGHEIRTAKDKPMNDQRQRDFAAGQREATRLLGRKARDDDDSKKKGDDADEEDERDDDVKTCPTCGQPIDDDHDDHDDEERDDDDSSDDEDRIRRTPSTPTLRKHARDSAKGAKAAQDLLQRTGRR